MPHTVKSFPIGPGCRLYRLQQIDIDNKVCTLLKLFLPLQWVQTKEEWDREKVYLAELGYVPDEADPEVKLLLDGLGFLSLSLARE